MLTDPEAHSTKELDMRTQPHSRQKTEFGGRHSSMQDAYTFSHFSSTLKNKRVKHVYSFTAAAISSSSAACSLTGSDEARIASSMCRSVRKPVMCDIHCHRAR